MPLASGSTAQTSPSSLLPQAVLRFGLSGALWVGGSTGRRFLASSSPVPLSDMSRLALFPCFPPSFASSPPVLLFPSPLLAPPGRPYSHPSPPPCILFHPTKSKARSGGGRGSRGASTIRYTKLTHPALGVLLAGDSVRRWGHPRCCRGRRGRCRRRHRRQRHRRLGRRRPPPPPFPPQPPPWPAPAPQTLPPCWLDNPARGHVDSTPEVLSWLQRCLQLTGTRRTQRAHMMTSVRSMANALIVKNNRTEKEHDHPQSFLCTHARH